MRSDYTPKRLERRRRTGRRRSSDRPKAEGFRSRPDKDSITGSAVGSADCQHESGGVDTESHDPTTVFESEDALFELDTSVSAGTGSGVESLKNGNTEDSSASKDECTSRGRGSESPSDRNSGESLVLLQKAASFDDLSKLNDPHSIESRLARSRGDVQIIDSDAIELDPGVQFDSEYSDSDDSEYTFLAVRDGKLNVESGYVMQFVYGSFADLSVADITRMLDLPVYPVPQSAFESLPRWAKERLENIEYLKCTASYDSEAKQFVNVREGWHTRYGNVADVLAAILEAYEGDKLARPVYYFINQFASAEYSDPESLAETRNIQKSTVLSEIRKAEEEIGDSNVFDSIPTQL